MYNVFTNNKINIVSGCKIGTSSIRKSGFKGIQSYEVNDLPTYIVIREPKSRLISGLTMFSNKPSNVHFSNKLLLTYLNTHNLNVSSYSKLDFLEYIVLNHLPSLLDNIHFNRYHTEILINLASFPQIKKIILVYQLNELVDTHSNISENEFKSKVKKYIFSELHKKNMYVFEHLKYYLELERKSFNKLLELKEVYNESI